ncbi:MAG: hypothetical protein ACFFG0_30250 [Candidatus Thorarchaeota archaeon]
MSENNYRFIFSLESIDKFNTENIVTLASIVKTKIIDNKKIKPQDFINTTLEKYKKFIDEL